MWKRARLTLLYRFESKQPDSFRLAPPSVRHGNHWDETFQYTKINRACDRRDVYGMLHAGVDQLMWRGDMDFRVMSKKGTILLFTDFTKGVVYYTRHLSWWQRLRFELRWKNLELLLSDETHRRVTRLDWRKA